MAALSGDDPTRTRIYRPEFDSRSPRSAHHSLVDVVSPDLLGDPAKYSPRSATSSRRSRRDRVPHVLDEAEVLSLPTDPSNSKPPEQTGEFVTVAATGFREE